MGPHNVGSIRPPGRGNITIMWAQDCRLGGLSPVMNLASKAATEQSRAVARGREGAWQTRGGSAGVAERGPGLWGSARTCRLCSCRAGSELLRDPPAGPPATAACLKWSESGQPEGLLQPPRHGISHGPCRPPPVLPVLSPRAVVGWGGAGPCLVAAGAMA